MKLFLSILEDDRSLLKYYKAEIERLLEKHGIPGEIVCITDNPDVFMNAVKSCKCNVCIIDINLRNNTNGMYIAREIRKLKIPTEIVFITGHLQYMKVAFQVRAFDYLEKPISTEELEKCLLRLYKEMDLDGVVKQDVLKIKSGTVVYHLPIDDIFYIEHSKFKSIIVTKNRHVETYESLTNIAKELPKDRFRQCHRAIWVNTTHIDTIDFSKGEIKLKNGMICYIGKTFKKGFADYAG